MIMTYEKPILITYEEISTITGGQNTGNWTGICG